MGSDAFFDIGTWKEASLIFKRVPLLVMDRAGDPVETEHMARLLEETVSKGYTFQKNKQAFYHPEMEPVHLVKVPEIQISSTQIREYIKSGRSITSMVPGPALNIIKQKRIYL